MAQTINLVINHKQYLRPLSKDMRREYMQDLMEVLRKVISGESTSGANIIVSDNAGQGLVTATFSGPATAADTFALSSSTLTAVASGANGTTTWNAGVSATADAASLAACINANATTGQYVTATASGAVITMTTNAAGAWGFLLTCSKSSTAITLSTTNFGTGATLNTPQTLLY